MVEREVRDTALSAAGGASLHQRRREEIVFIPPSGNKGISSYQVSS